MVERTDLFATWDDYFLIVAVSYRGWLAWCVFVHYDC